MWTLVVGRCGAWGAIQRRKERWTGIRDFNGHHQTSGHRVKLQLLLFLVQALLRPQKFETGKRPKSDFVCWHGPVRCPTTRPFEDSGSIYAHFIIIFTWYALKYHQ